MSRRSFSGAISARHDRIRRSGSNTWGGCLLYGFFGIFAVAGIATFFFLAVMPIWNLISARSWQPTNCEILSSHVESHSGSDSTTYSIEITFAYQVDGRFYESDKYNFAPDGSSSGRSSKQEVVDRYPAGFETTCYYDPEDPSRAVIDRSPGWFLLWALFPIPFAAVGIGGLIFLILQPKEARKADPIRKWAPSRAGAGDRGTAANRLVSSVSAARSAASGGSSSGVRVGSPGEPPPAPTSNAPVNLEPSHPPLLTGLVDVEAFQPDASGRLVLEPSTSNKAKAVGMGIVALIVNVLIAIFGWSTIRDAFGPSGHIDWFSLIFMLPFLLAGLATIVGTIYFALAMGNPVPKLVLDRPHPTLGDTCRVAWTFDGRVDKLEILTLTLRGKERATYRRGTNTVTERHTFHEEELVRIDRFIDVRGSAEFTIPMDTMPTFFAERNEIEWQLEIHGDIPNWPDVKEKMNFPIYPPGIDPSTLGKGGKS